jgi:hypothetical protein
MYGQYIADGTVDASLLLLGEVTPSDAAALIAALGPLTAGCRERVAIHQLPGWAPQRTLRIDAFDTARDGRSPRATLTAGLGISMSQQTKRRVVSYCLTLLELDKPLLISQHA